jgi:hypothetical protein
MTYNRRRAFPVISSLQYRFLSMTLIYSFIIVCFFAIAIFGPDIVEMRDQSLSLEIRSSAASRVIAKHSWVWPSVISLIIVLGLHSFRAFHRVIGPLYRFRWAFEQLQNGNLLWRVKTREKDYLQSEEAALNKMLETLSFALTVTIWSVWSLRFNFSVLKVKSLIAQSKTLEGNQDAPSEEQGNGTSYFATGF